jgi:hypothetical protein
VRAGTDEDRLALEFFHLPHVVVGDEDRGLLLHESRNSDQRHATFADLHLLNVAGPHDAVGLSGRHQLHDVDLRAAHLHGHVQAVLLVDALGDGLVEAAVLGLCVPVGHVREPLVGLRCRCAQGHAGGASHAGDVSDE